MRTDRAGVSLVEFIVALGVGAFLLAVAFQTVIVQEQGYRTADAIVHDQDALRTALGILEGELREAASVGGSDIGGTDLLSISADSVRVRSSRKLGFACGAPTGSTVDVWSQGDLFEAGDQLLIFVDDDATTHRDDHWVTAQVQSIASAGMACATVPAGAATQQLQLGSSLTGMIAGAPVRAVETVTYGLYAWGDGWGLGRRDSDGTLHHFVSGLAATGEGLVLEYFDEDGNVTTDPAAVSSISIQLVTDPPASSGKEPSSITSTVYLRNN